MFVKNSEGFTGRGIAPTHDVCYRRHEQPWVLGNLLKVSHADDRRFCVAPVSGRAAGFCLQGRARDLALCMLAVFWGL